MYDAGVHSKLKVYVNIERKGKTSTVRKLFCVYTYYRQKSKHK